MARMEFQISTELLQKAVQSVLEPRLYKQCSVSPVEGLILDRVSIATIGPIVASPIDLVITVQATIHVVTPDDVIKAAGRSAHSSLAPNGVQLSGSVRLTMSGTKLTGVWEGINHDARYHEIYTIVAAIAGKHEASTLFTQWEKKIHDALGSSPVISEDLGKQLPAPFDKQRIGRTAITGNDGAIVIRLEVGSPGSDGFWLDMILGQFKTFIKKGKWGLFISGDVLTGLLDASLFAAVAHAGVVANVNSDFVKGPPEFVPGEGKPESMAQVNAVVTIPFTVTYKFLGVTVETDHGDVQVNANTDFVVVVDGKHAELEIFLGYNIDVNLGGFLSDFIQIFANLGDIVSEHLGGLTLPNFTALGDDVFVSKIKLEPVNFASLLTLSFATASFHKVVEPLPSGPVLGAPEYGMLLEGDASVAVSPKAPDCMVSKTDFSLVFQPSQGTAAKTAAFASADIVNEKPDSGTRYPLVIGQFLPVLDPNLLWIDMLPKTPAKGGKFTFKKVESDVSAAYFEHPYPVAMIVCTNGGARYVNLGPIPKPSKFAIGQLIEGLTKYSLPTGA